MPSLLTTLSLTEHKFAHCKYSDNGASMLLDRPNEDDRHTLRQTRGELCDLILYTSALEAAVRDRDKGEHNRQSEVVSLRVTVCRRC